MTKISSVKFGNDEKIKLFELENDYIKVGILNYGATIQSIVIKALKQDVVYGFDDIEGYYNQDKYYGASVGRVAGRISKGHFKINDKNYNLAINNNGNALHGGIKGFDKQIFSDEINNETLELSYVAHDLEEGYPGNLKVIIRYMLIKKSLICEYEYCSDKDTLVNLTNHSYFNLHTKEDAMKQTLLIKADEILRIDENGCPLNERLKVKNTPFDFNDSFEIMARLEEEHEQLKAGNGIDHYYIFKKDHHQIKLVSIENDLSLTLNTDYPGANIYSANYLNGEHKGKNSTYYNKRSAICLEAQSYPNDININEGKQSILRANEIKKHFIEYIFNWEDELNVGK